MSEVENKVRGTRKLFKEFKSFLTDYLKQIDPVVSGENGGHLGHLLQVSDCFRSINQLVIEIFTICFNYQCSKLHFQLLLSNYIFSILFQVMWTSFQGCINDNIPATSEESYIKMSFLVSTTCTQSYRNRHNLVDWT